jgi:hypothetical protein
VAAGFAAALVFSATAFAQRGAKPAVPAPDSDTCLSCHGDPAAKSDAGRAIGLDGKAFGASIHGGLACVDCHTDLARTQDFPHAEKLAKVSCGACHEDAVTAYDRSIHARARREQAASVAATCTDCHTSHAMRSAKDPASQTYALKLPDTCGRCHGDPRVIQQGHIRIGNVVDLYRDSIHGKAVAKSGLVVAANCTSCHGSHDIRPKSDAESRVNRANVPGTCGACHEGIKLQYGSGVHGQALAKGSTEAPMCADCHTAHGIQRADVTNWQLDVIRECGTCHEDKIRTYRDTFHGQVTSLGFVRVATCAACHGAHVIHPASDPRSMVSTENRLKTCQQCHPSATDGFARYDPHADKDNRDRNPVLYHSARLMKWLLVGVFGFFGLHTLLWLPRGLKERRKA